VDVYLINVRSPRAEAEQTSAVMFQKVLGRRLSPSEPLGLAVLAACTPAGIHLRAVDENVADVDLEAGPDLVGLSFHTPCAPRAYELAAHFRSRSIPVVMGGPHVSLLPDEARLHADHIVTGEAERAWPAFLNDFRSGRAKPSYAGSPCPGESMPLARWDIYPRDAYLARTLQASRGCPNNCDFCANIRLSDRRLRLRPPDNVIREMSTRLESPGRRIFFIVDNDLFADTDWSMALVDRIKDLGVDWWGFASVKAGSHPELLKRMAQSGCRYLIVGFESLSEDSLKAVHKPGNLPDLYTRIVRTIQDRGIAVHASFVLGLDGDGPDIFERTARFAENQGILIANINVATPYPGTELHRRLDRQGRLLHRNWELYDRTHVCFKPAKMSVEELAEGYRALSIAINGRSPSWRRLRSFLASAPADPPIRSMTASGGPKLKTLRRVPRFLRRTSPADWAFYIRLLTARRLGPPSRRLFYATAGYLMKRDFVRYLKGR
jgi:radical SAM superfamily enzyme YgiQ (UPF0313 family)